MATLKRGILAPHEGMWQEKWKEWDGGKIVHLTGPRTTGTSREKKEGTPV